HTVGDVHQEHAVLGQRVGVDLEGLRGQQVHRDGVGGEGVQGQDVEGPGLGVLQGEAPVADLVAYVSVGGGEEREELGVVGDPHHLGVDLEEGDVLTCAHITRD